MTRKMIPFHLVAYGATKVDTNMTRSQKPAVSETVSPVGHHSPQFMRLDDAKVGRLRAQNLQPGSHGWDELQ